jgi:SAM-dependent methyltransferase
MDARGYGAAPLAAAYNRLLGPALPAQVMPVCERLLFPGLPAGAAVLELGCGTGHVAAALLARGFAVTGLDLAPEMLAHAAENAPGARFVAADLRRFELPAVYDAGLMIGSVGHLAGAGDLATAFANIYRALRPGACLLFDAYLPGEFGDDRHFTHLADDLAVIFRESYLGAERRSRAVATIFHRLQHPEDADWQRWDGTWHETYHPAADLAAALLAAGFEAPRFHDAARDLGQTEHAERTYVVARRPGAARS